MRDIAACRRNNQGIIPDLRKPEAESDFYFVKADDSETAALATASQGALGTARKTICSIQYGF
jgi:hypothetical protein